MTKYVIRATDGESGKITGYWAIDRDSGSPYWGSFFSAKIFNGEDAAKIIETDSELHQVSKMADSSVFPPRMVHSGANINYAKLNGSVIVEVVEIVERPVFTRVFHGHIVEKSR